MKKLFSVLFCFVFLTFWGCSTKPAENSAAVTVEEVRPEIVVKLHSYWSKPDLGPSYDPEQNYYMMYAVIKNWSDFQSFELLMTFDPNVLTPCDAPGTLMRPGITFRELVFTEQAPGVLRIIGRDVEHAATEAFDSLSFLVIGEGEPNIDISFVSATDKYGQNVDCILEVEYSVA